MAKKLTSKDTLTIRLGSDLQAPISNTFTDISGMNGTSVVLKYLLFCLKESHIPFD